jgi:hypothetical protein
MRSPVKKEKGNKVLHNVFGLLLAKPPQRIAKSLEIFTHWVAAVTLVRRTFLCGG